MPGCSPLFGLPQGGQGSARGGMDRAPVPVSAVSAVGRRGPQGWELALLGGGETLALLPIDEARALAAEILLTCDAVEGRGW